MKKALIIILCFSFALSTTLAQETTNVTLKNGSIITGIIKEFNPTSHIIISVSGFDTRIEMSDVDSVKAERNTNKIQSSQHKTITDLRGIVPQDILDREDGDYPDSFIINVGDVQIEMVLVRGGLFSMGYDGRGSLAMNSEPVHQVYVSSFYISKSCLNKGEVDYILGNKTTHQLNTKPFSCRDWSKANEIITLLSNQSALPIHLPYEAEWEYLASSPSRRSLIEYEVNEKNFCYDVYEDYPDQDGILVNPTGPKGKSKHVIRVFGPQKEDYCRRYYEKQSTPPMTSASIRCVIPIEAITK